MSHADALQELRACSGSQFDPELVEAFCDRVYGQLYNVDGDGLQPDADVVGASDVTGGVA
jgi:HD-GYP domain-containing protein (c-di-GMP phosphodiesterase class II)